LRHDVIRLFYTLRYVIDDVFRDSRRAAARRERAMRRDEPRVLRGVEDDAFATPAALLCAISMNDERHVIMICRVVYAAQHRLKMPAL